MHAAILSVVLVVEPTDSITSAANGRLTINDFRIVQPWYDSAYGRACRRMTKETLTLCAVVHRMAEFCRGCHLSTTDSYTYWFTVGCCTVITRLLYSMVLIAGLEWPFSRPQCSGEKAYWGRPLKLRLGLHPSWKWFVWWLRELQVCILFQLVATARCSSCWHIVDGASMLPWRSSLAAGKLHVMLVGQHVRYLCLHGTRLCSHCVLYTQFKVL